MSAPDGEGYSARVGEELEEVCAKRPTDRKDFANLALACLDQAGLSERNQNIVRAIVEEALGFEIDSEWLPRVSQ